MIIVIMAKIIFGQFLGSLCCLWPSLLVKNGGGGKKGQKVLNKMTQEQVRLGENFVQLFPVFQKTFSYWVCILKFAASTASLDIV